MGQISNEHTKAQNERCVVLKPNEAIFVIKAWHSHSLLNKSFPIFLRKHVSKLEIPAAKTTSVKVNHLVGLVVKASASRAEDPGFVSLLRRDFSGVESYQ